LSLAATVLPNFLVPAGVCSGSASAPLPPTLEKSRLLAEEATAGARNIISSSPLYFTENRGQIDSRVRYYVQGRDTTIYFTLQGLTFALAGKEGVHSHFDGAHRSDVPGAMSPAAQAEGISAERRWTVNLNFVGANPRVKPAGLDPTSTVIS